MPLFKSTQISVASIALALLALIISCFFPPAQVQAGSTLPKENQLLSVNIEKAGIALTVDIRAKNPLDNRYSIYDAFSPLRVVIDLPGMDVSGMDVEGLTTPIKVNMAPIKDIHVSSFNLASGKLGRIELLLTKASEHHVTLSENNCNLYVSFGPKPPPPPATTALPEKTPEQDKGLKTEKEHLPLMGASSGDKSVLSALIRKLSAPKEPPVPKPSADAEKNQKSQDARNLKARPQNKVSDIKAPTPGGEETEPKGENLSISIEKIALPALPPEVTTALLPPAALESKIDFTALIEPRFDVSAEKIPAREFFQQLVAGTPYNIAVNPDVAGSISLTLKNATIPEIMDMVRTTYGYRISHMEASFQVLPGGLQSKTFHVNYPPVTESKNLSGCTDDSSGGTNKQADPKYTFSFWKDLENAVCAIIGDKEGRHVALQPQAAMLTVHALPEELRQVENYLDTLQDKLQDAF